MDQSKLSKKLNQIQKLTEECLSFLSGNEKNARKRKSLSKVAGSIERADIDFSVPLRPFVKKYSKGMSGPKKFTLLLARLSKGDLSVQISFADIEKSWNSMNSLFGIKFNPYYSQVAKDNDWVVSKKKGTYSLRPSWTDIF